MAPPHIGPKTEGGIGTHRLKCHHRRPLSPGFSTEKRWAMRAEVSATTCYPCLRNEPSPMCPPMCPV